ncbi:uncharacterized protein CDAR_609461 [Caerostris darwini]|uniref:Uncharacterized protein n=1 Tax=Caerostris darwini TaxID=1538125 RepID=A0AAV4VWJ4_9ARAC|nr:uncharacterized protein CDAR_609461 [Caerostris darwini]
MGFFCAYLLHMDEIRARKRLEENLFVEKHELDALSRSPSDASRSRWGRGVEPCRLRRGVRLPPPPPPRFLIPPPPAPPSSALCRGEGAAASDLHFCQMEPVGAEFTQTAFPSLPIIAVCSSVVLVAVLVTSFLLWK